MFFIRAAFWLALVVAFIPVRETDLAEGQKPVSTAETVGLAQTVVTDIGSFCVRNPSTCETGGTLLSQMGLKAREGARLAYTWLDKRYGNTNTHLAGSNAVNGLQSGQQVDPVTTSATRNSAQ